MEGSCCLFSSVHCPLRRLGKLSEISRNWAAKKLCDICIRTLGEVGTYQSHCSPHHSSNLRHWMLSELAWPCAGVEAPKNRGACRCGSSVVDGGSRDTARVQSMALLSCYGNSLRFNAGGVSEAKERKLSNSGAAVVPIDLWWLRAPACKWHDARQVHRSPVVGKPVFS